MLNPISVAFKKAKAEKRPALLTYTVAGDSSKKQSLDILKSISKNADILEVGVPHNTPVADGSQIQTSAYRAIKKGIKINDIFKIVRDFKKFDKNKPIILMGYYNMIFQFGDNNFLNKCKNSGVNGLIVVDLPWPENKNFAKKCKRKSIYFIQLLSPTTTSKRLKKIIKNSHPMNYFISMLSTTGGKLKVSPKEILKNYNKIKRINPKKEIVIGFGITDKTIGKLKSADGLVVGSAICKEITRSLNSRQNPVTNVGKLVRKLKKQNKMNWITKIIKAGEKIKSAIHKRASKEDIANSDWTSCCKGPILKKNLEENLWVCPDCNKHHRIKPKQRFDILFGKDNYEIFKTPIPKDDPLNWTDSKSYKDRLKSARKKTGMDCGMMVVSGVISDIRITAVASDFDFLGASMAAAEGEAFLYGIQNAIENKTPFLCVSAGGGMRMMESLISLSQMTRTTLAINELKNNNLPYLVCITDPTAGGITASYAMLGDIHIAEPGALIAFAGARVIQGTVKEELPEGFQKSEYVEKTGFVDLIVERKDLAEKIGTLLSILLKKKTVISTEQDETTENTQSLSKIA